MVDYSEILMQSMDVLVKQRLSELEFDKTIVCHIVDTSNAEKGEYEVTDGATTFVAYSKDVTYKVDDSVYVTIPNGDYGNQKIIVGKHVGQGESLTYLSPLDSFINITGDLCNLTTTASLLANSFNTVKSGEETYQTPCRKTIWKADVQNGKGFERLGISAEFKTWLKKLKVNSGNYGLCLFVTYLDKANVNSEDSEKVAQFLLDSNNMNGNPYNYESFYSQSRTFDITHITGQITKLELVFYQDGNFGTSMGTAAPTTNEDGETLLDNIYVQNVQVSFGYDITKFNEDAVLIYCMNESTYNINNLSQENHKVLQLRWVRATEEGIYSVDSEDEIPENAVIHWYKYQLKAQDEVDELAGPFWFEIEEGKNKLTLEVDPDTSEYSQLYKAIIETPSREWITNQLDEDMSLDYKLLVINAEGKADDSEEKQLLAQYENDIKSQRKIYTSEPIEFKSEVPVFDKMTADLINGLKIVVDEKGYKGNYLLYNLSNQIQNPNEATKMRVMQATYKSLVTGEQTLDGAESIIWKIPLMNTMIYPPEDGKEYKSSDAATSYWIENGYAYIQRLSGRSAAISTPQDPGTVSDWTCEQKFRIKDYYQESATNNTVFCYVVKNNVAYEASQELTFGPMGTNGTDFTFRMSFDSDVPGVTGNGEGAENIIKINIALFDFNNEKVPNFWDKGVNITWYHKDSANALSFCNADGSAVEKPTIGQDKCFYIKYDPTKGIPHAAILQAQVTADPTVQSGEKVLNAVKLTCHLPIPYRDNKEYSGIEGATKILYDSSGTKAEYYKEKYRLWKTTADARVEETDITWTIISPEYEKTGVVTVEEEYYENGVKKTRTVQKNSKPNYFPKLTEANTIMVPSMYTELDDDIDRNIYVTAVKGGKVLWSQPIMMTKDAFSSTMLNSWDGSLTIDENNGTILSTMIGAGKKDSENRFEGVLMGDVKCALNDSIKAGLYGFSEGVQSFGWMIDGTGFIGKSGQGQILFNGNQGTITSGIWKQTGGKVGMEIDLDGPANGKSNWSSTGSTMKMFGAAGKVTIDTSKTSTKLFLIEGRNNPVNASNVAINDPELFDYDRMFCISIDTDTAHTPEGTDEVSANTSFYLQSLGYQPTKKGEVKAHGTRLDLQNGNYYSFGKYGRIQFAVNENTFFRLADADNNVLFIIKGTTSTDDANGTDAVAQVSQYYLQSSNFNTSDKIGTRLDLQKGKYTSYGKFGRIEMAPDTNTFFRLADANNNVLFVIKGGKKADNTDNKDSDGDIEATYYTSQYYIQSSNFNAGSKQGTRFDLQNGKLTTYGDSGYIIIDSKSNAMFRIFAKHKVNNVDKYFGLMYVGNSSTYYIQNLNWATSNGAKGSKWNLNDGSFYAYGDGGKIQIQPDTAGALFVVKDSAGTSLINIGSGTSTGGSNYYLQSSGYQLSTKDTKGKGFRIDIGDGTISASDFNLFAKGDSGYIQIGTSGTYAIDVNNKFQVAWDGDTHLRSNAALYVESGNIYSGKKGGNGDNAPGKYYNLTPTGGTIGPWHIGEDGIWANSDSSSTTTGSSADSYLGTNGTMRLRSSNMVLQLSYGSFKVVSTDEGGTASEWSGKPNIFLNSTALKAAVDGGNLLLGHDYEGGDPDSYSDKFEVNIGKSRLTVYNSSIFISTNTNTSEVEKSGAFSASNGTVYIRGGRNVLKLSDSGGLEVTTKKAGTDNTYETATGITGSFEVKIYRAESSNSTDGTNIFGNFLTSLVGSTQKIEFKNGILVKIGPIVAD